MKEVGERDILPGFGGRGRKKYKEESGTCMVRNRASRHSAWRKKGPGGVVW